MAALEIPLSPNAQSFFIALGGQTYFLTWRWNETASCWMLSIADAARVPILDNIPVVTGRDLLAPYAYLGFEGSLVVQTDNNPDAVPTLANLGQQGRVYYVQ